MGELKSSHAYIFILFYVLSLRLSFLNPSQIGQMYFNVNTKEKHIFYIGCEMKFKYKKYGFNFLVSH